MRPLPFCAVTCCFLICLAEDAGAQRRTLQAEDLFRVERIGAITRSPDGRRAVVEIRRSGDWLDRALPHGEIAVVDLSSGAMRVIARSSAGMVGFFGAAWAPDSRRLVLLSVDTNAVTRPWLWTVGTNTSKPLGALQLRDGTADPPVAAWSDNDHVILLLKEPSQPDDGPSYFRIRRGANVATAWQRARQGRVAAVTVLDAQASDSMAPSSRLVSVDVRSGAQITLARGALHRPRLSADRKTLTYRSESPPVQAARVASFFGPDAQGDAAYDGPALGHAIHHIDPRTGAAVSPPDSAQPRAPGDSSASLRTDNDPSTGTTLSLVRPGRADTVIWRGNAWVRSIDTGRSEAIQYTATDGKALTGWLLYPPRHVAGRPIPVVTWVYPSNVYGARTPGAFSLLDQSSLHPQMLAALDYGVIFPSMPEPEKPMQARGIDALSAGVFPLLDTLIARGIVDSSRIAVMGHSAGGYATLGLITQTRRFRTAIASASYANLTSLYGTFYGQYRHGDSGHPLRAQLLRMLQFERGYYGAGAPPWDEPERYRVNSPIIRVAEVQTPVMLIHGELDFIPVQQAEEFFTALYRQDKRVQLVRYAGEGHVPNGRANILDLWTRVAAWLRETMPPGAAH